MLLNLSLILPLSRSKLPFIPASLLFNSSSSVSSINVVFTLLISADSGLKSFPIECRLFKNASTRVVPHPQKGSTIVSFSFVNSLINVKGMCGINLAG